jgi:hypothetical protein
VKIKARVCSVDDGVTIIVSEGTEVAMAVKIRTNWKLVILGISAASGGIFRAKLASQVRRAESTSAKKTTPSPAQAVYRLVTPCWTVTRRRRL